MVGRGSPTKGYAKVGSIIRKITCKAQRVCGTFKEPKETQCGWKPQRGGRKEGETET